MSETTPPPADPADAGPTTTTTAQAPGDEAAASGSELSPPDLTDVAAARARLVVPTLRPAAPVDPAPLPPAPPTYREMEHLLRDLA